MTLVGHARIHSWTQFCICGLKKLASASTCADADASAHLWWGYCCFSLGHWLHSWFYRNTAVTTLTSMVKLYIGHENRLRISSRDRTPISASQSFWRHFSRTETRLKNKNRSVWLVWQCRPVCMPKRCWMCIQSMSYIIILTWCVLENILLCCKRVAIKTTNNFESESGQHNNYMCGEVVFIRNVATLHCKL